MNNIKNFTIDTVFESDTTLSLANSAMAIDSKNLADTAAYSFETDDFGFTAKVARADKSLVFFSVPYDKGWSATVNGKSVDIEKVNIGFMAVPVESDNSTIRFNYETPMLTLGIKVTIVATVVFLIYFIVATIFVKYRGKDTVYPEGEELLKNWHKDDIAEAAALYSGRHSAENTKRRSILDDDEIKIPDITPKVSGGFTIDLDAFKEDEK